jgi:hypothetical protein
MDLQSVEKIKKWLSLESEISNHSSILRELRKEKNALNNELVSIMKQNNVECFDCNSGQIKFSRNNVKRGLNKKTLHEILEKYFVNASPGEAEKLCEYINENRGIEIKENVKLKKNK